MVKKKQAQWVKVPNTSYRVGHVLTVGIAVELVYSPQENQLPPSLSQGLNGAKNVKYLKCS